MREGGKAVVQSRLATVTDGSKWTVYVGDAVYGEFTSGKQADDCANELRPYLKGGADVWDAQIRARILGPGAEDGMRSSDDVVPLQANPFFLELSTRIEASVGRLHGELALHTQAFNANVIEFTKALTDFEKRLSSLEKAIRVTSATPGGVSERSGDGAPAGTGSERSGADG